MSAHTAEVPNVSAPVARITVPWWEAEEARLLLAQRERKAAIRAERKAERQRRKAARRG